MSWGISEKAQVKERIKAEVNDILIGMSSFGDIDYNTYSNLYDNFTSALDKMAELSTSVCDDSGFVIYDKKNQLYYCGLKKWNNQLRQAQIFHSEKYLLDRIDSFKEEFKKKSDGRFCQIPFESLDNLVVRKVTLLVVDTYDIADFEKKSK